VFDVFSLLLFDCFLLYSFVLALPTFWLKPPKGPRLCCVCAVSYKFCLWIVIVFYNSQIVLSSWLEFILLFVILFYLLRSFILSYYYVIWFYLLVYLSFLYLPYSKDLAFVLLVSYVCIFFLLFCVMFFNTCF
jgi:hypothetical protein